MSAPEEVVQLAQQRLVARAAKDFQLADALRNQIALLGWEIFDKAGGFDMQPKSPFPVYQRVAEIQDIDMGQFKIVIGIIVDGFTEDAASAISSITAACPDGYAVVALINGEHDAAPLVRLIDSRVKVIGLTHPAGWGEAANALIKRINTPYLVIMDPSTRFLGDALTPVIAELETGTWSAIGWRGGLVDIDDGWRSVLDRGPGEVDVLFSYFMALRREAALDAGGFNARAAYYRNADIEFSLRLRQIQGRLLQMDLPLEQARHHGYYDVDPEYRDQQSKKNYDRILERFRGKVEILSPRR